MRICKTRHINCELRDPAVEGLNEAFNVYNVWSSKKTSFFAHFLDATSWVIIAGTAVSSIPKARSRMIVSENPCNGIIVIAYDVEDSDILGVEDHLLTAQNTVSFL